MTVGTMPDEKTKLVYSTDTPVPRKEKPAGKPAGPALSPAEQRVIVRLDRRQRGGKSVTVIEGLELRQEEREALLKKLKAGLGTGGTIRDSSFEIQGDHCDALLSSLTKMGYRPKRSGG
ncbi:MAG: translation initiation factor [Thermodesulfovibrionales bacterium]